MKPTHTPQVPAAESTPQAESTPRGVPLRAGSQAHTILVVDDNAAMRRALVRLLRRDGHRVESAVNGREGLAKLAVQEYDYILCDLHMPGLDGPGMYRTLEQQTPHLCLRFIFFTGDALSPTAAAFLRQVPVPYLTKPFTAIAIRQIIRPAAAT